MPIDINIYIHTYIHTCMHVLMRTYMYVHACITALAAEFEAFVASKAHLFADIAHGNIAYFRSGVEIFIHSHIFYVCMCVYMYMDE